MTQLSGKTIGFIGGGAIAEAFSGGLIGAGVPADKILVAEPKEPRREALAKRLGVRVTEDNAQVAAEADLIVLCVKPDIVPRVLAKLVDRGDLDLARPLWVTIAAGVRIHTVSDILPNGCRIVRAMPNTPVLVREGATAYCGNGHADEDDLAAARALFEAVGVSWEAPREDLLDAVTGLSGSGPAYVFVFLEALGDAGVRCGLPRAAAYQLAFQTVLGSAKLAIETGRHPAELKDQVTSPAGTTIEGLERLEAGGFRSIVYRCVLGATERARELGEQS